jgi:hypothetical protein
VKIEVPRARLDTPDAVGKDVVDAVKPDQVHPARRRNADQQLLSTPYAL